MKVKKRKYQKCAKKGLTKLADCAKIIKLIHVIGVSAIHGEVSEWFKELVLKTSDPARDRGFESHPLRQHFSYIFNFVTIMQKYSSGDEAPLLRA